MAETSERVTVRIPQDLLEKLKEIQTAKGTATISDTIREGLERYIEMNLPPPNIKKVVVDLSRQDNHQLEEFVREGGSVSIDDAVRSAVREYIRVRLEQTTTTSTRPRREGEAATVAVEGVPPP
ncbi:MAG TPA: ribbon-helix-helix domain-containing protein [Thermoplasmata archaeon]|nr:ribbon-helix-helix domain-containing protein [Thermoplasmata archaeon]